MDTHTLAQVDMLLRRAVLRIVPLTETAAGPAAGGSRPWFAGAQACLEAVAALVGGESLAAAGFGGPWPALEISGRVLAPGFPMAVGTSPREGPDAIYWREGDEVWRSANRGAERVLALGVGASPPGCAIDLLWFGDGERYLLTGGDLMVDDRFSRLRVAADPAWLEHELVRRHRVDRGVVSGLPTRPSCRPSRIEVRRAVNLLPTGIWDDPAAVLAAREGVEHADLLGDRLLLRLAAGQEVQLMVSSCRGGWRAERSDGEWPYLAAEIAAEGTDLTYAAELDPRIDPLRPGVRTRLAFDLVSDLVVLGGATSPSDMGP